MVLALLGLNPGGLLAWIVIGLVAGWLASTIMRGGAHGLVGDIVVGLIGALIGGLVMTLLAPDENVGFWGSLVVAIIGAVVLIALLRVLGRGAPRL